MTRDTGGGPANPLTVRLVELIEDGEWHELDPLLRKVGKLVPPGKALRRAERTREVGRDAPPERVRPVEAEALIDSGRRQYARYAMHSARGSFEQKADSDGVTWVRLVSIPPRVQRDRDRELAARAAESARAARLSAALDELRDGADAHELLSGLPSDELLSVAVMLAEHCQHRWEADDSDASAVTD